MNSYIFLSVIYEIYIYIFYILHIFIWIVLNYFLKYSLTVSWQSVILKDFLFVCVWHNYEQSVRTLFTDVKAATLNSRCEVMSAISSHSFGSINDLFFLFYFFFSHSKQVKLCLLFVKLGLFWFPDTVWRLWRFVLFVFGQITAFNLFCPMGLIGKILARQ